MNKNSGAEVHADDAATNVSTDIDPTSGSRGSPREGGDYENTSSNEVKTQGASGMDNDRRQQVKETPPSIFCCGEMRGNG